MEFSVHIMDIWLQSVPFTLKGIKSAMMQPIRHFCSLIPKMGLKLAYRIPQQHRAYLLKQLIFFYFSENLWQMAKMNSDQSVLNILNNVKDGIWCHVPCCNSYISKVDEPNLSVW